MRSLLKALNILVTTILVGIVILAGGLNIAARASKDRTPTILGRKVLSVLSGSMRPALGVGDVVVVRPLSPTDPIKDGDIITYRSNAGDQNGMLITHRVISTVLVNGKPTAFITKGDANDSPDVSPIKREQVMGVYQFRVPYMGYLSAFIRTPLGILLVLILPSLLFISGEVIKIYKLLKEAEAAKAVKPGIAEQGQHPE